MDSRSNDPTAPGADPASSGDSVEQNGGDDAPTPGESFYAAQQSVAQLVEYIRYLISAKVDALKLSMRTAALYAVLGVVALIAAAALVVTAVALLCIGLAQTISAIFRAGPWLGNLVTGLLLLGGIVGVVMVVMKRMTGQSRERTVSKYAARQQQQRAKFGEDVSNRSGPVD